MINCLAQDPGFRIGEKVIHNATFFPRYAVLGSQHISHEEETVTEVRFVIEDESVLFHDPDVFGVEIEPPHSLVEQAVRHQIDGVGEIKTGEFSYISYHIGRKQVFEEADTVCGKIRAFHNPVLNLAKDRLSAEIGTKVFITLKFPSPTVFEEAIERTFRVRRFFELLIGRSQNLVEFLLYKECGHEEAEILEVHGRDFPKHEPSENKPKKDFTDVLIRAVRNPEEFPRVLENWLRKEEDEGWRRARGRFFSFFRTRNSYDPDRLIRAANMFDLLPREAVPAEKELSEKVKIEYERSRKAFRELSPSRERDKFLNALGWASKNSLKDKVRHRAQLVVNEIGDEITEPGFFMVTDEAVDCRNYYVHGDSGNTRIDYDNEPHIMVFLTDTLEFVFGVSDLIEDGWDVKIWREEAKDSVHPFSRYLDHYEENWQKLENLIKKN